MKILITGGAGYLGTALTEALAGEAEVEEIVIYDNLSRHQYNAFLGPQIAGSPKVRFFNADVLDSRRLRKALEEVDVVYNLAAKVTTPFANSDPHFYEQVNHWGTAELVYALEDMPGKKLVHASSSAVYGASSEMILDDQAPRPRTFYGISKLRGENHVRRLIEHIPTVVLRMGNVYGYNRSVRFDAVINRFMFDAHFNGRITVHGNGQQQRAFLHIAQAANLLKQAGLNEVPSGVYNVVDRNLAVLDVVEAIQALYPEVEFIFINQHLILRELVVDPDSALRKHLNFLPPADLQDELKEFATRFAF